VSVEPERDTSRPVETILLVEDEEAVLDLTRDLLAANGYAVVRARHPSEALLVAEHHRGPIHLLLTDIVMPHMTGRALAGYLRVLRPGIKVLYMSGYPDDILANQRPLDPGSVILSKPFTEDALLETVRGVLGTPPDGARAA
jgi:CheY-like chemotaxis protein